MTELDPRLLESLARLDRRVAALEAATTATGSASATTPAKPAGLVVWWPALTQGQAVSAWDALQEWVREKLLARHPQHGWTLRPCWRAHPDVVDELTALRAVWLDAYTNPDAKPTAAADYLGRWLPAAMTRIEAAFGRCRTEAGVNVHTEDDTRWALPSWTGEQVSEFLEADLQDRAV